MLIFILKGIYDVFESGVNSTDADDHLNQVRDQKDFVIQRFFGKNIAYDFITFLDKLITSDPKIKIILYLILSKIDAKDDTTGIVEIGKKICSLKELKDKIAEQKDNFETVISIIYYLVVELEQFCMYKTFIDDDWKEMWVKYYKLGGFFKNLCENNSIFFKRYLSTIKPNLKDNNFCQGSNLLYDYYIRQEQQQSHYQGWYIRSPRLNMSDRPEIFIGIMRHISIITEMVNGPCPFNQRLIFRFRTDVWMGLLKREIDDVNSSFYKMKDTSLEYILSLMEGEGFYPLDDDVPDKKNKFLVSNLMCSNITPRALFELMTGMIKKLMMYRLMQKDSKFRDSILRKVKQKRLEEQKRQLESA